MDEHNEPDARSVPEEVVMNFEDSCPQPAAAEVRRLIEGSPLGTPGARAVRNRIPREQAESVVARLRARRADQHQGAANGNDQTDIPADSVLSEDASVASPVAAADAVKVDKLSESQLQTLEDSFFGRPLGEILQIEDESRDRRRQEILENLAASIDDVTGVSTAQVTRETAFVNDLGIDSLTALKLGVQVEEAYGIRITIEDLAGLHTVGDAVDFIEETTWLRGRTCAVNSCKHAPLTLRIDLELRGSPSRRIVELDEADFFRLKIGNSQGQWTIRVTTESTVPGGGGLADGSATAQVSDKP